MHKIILKVQVQNIFHILNNHVYHEEILFMCLEKQHVFRPRSV